MANDETQASERPSNCRVCLLEGGETLIILPQSSGHLETSVAAQRSDVAIEAGNLRPVEEHFYRVERGESRRIIDPLPRSTRCARLKTGNFCRLDNACHGAICQAGG